ncbi:PDR/VanB family oxidoreductase [Rhodococcus coprophilus]|uniref:Oxidoreductase n=1 Tax=Rhodococcus coprophilus TaxID=38310 RepID=A0A2X4U9P2_9NOCA|nr:PDR/VanB family oxidoreductase [Rhodococcus coprophilus]MBM7461491.1 ferredoxin-NADP reductase [Rhodococcus coprophilus]SQI29500.1 oxidoreductase [Rhodococcus coprophilus]
MTTISESPVGTVPVETGAVLSVGDITELSPTVRHLRLIAPDGHDLPSFTPGSHIVVTCGTGTDGRPRRNSYSLTGPGFEPDHYGISVRRDEAGRGGSRWIHHLKVGDPVSVSTPRSAFAPVLTAKHHVLVAGGIGVTPILSHVRAAVQWGRSFEVHYTFRADEGPHLDELRLLCGTTLHTYAGSDVFWESLGPALLDQPIGTHLYVCGPAGLIDETTARARSAGWPDARVHYEHFGVGDLDPGHPFTAHLRRTGTDVKVDSGISLLEALETQGIAVPNLCRQGVCGECRLPVVGGEVEHRDLYLTAAEKEARDCLMPCVSRASGQRRLELDL